MLLKLKTFSNYNFFTLIFVIFLTGCNGSKGEGGIIASISDSISEIVSGDPSVTIAKNQVSQIKNTLNQDNAYALTSEDIEVLKTEGITLNESEIKAWVK